MTEFQIATLSLQNTTMILQALGVAVGIAQCVLIAWGLRLMQQNATARDAGIAAGAKADDQRHAETMRALEALIARTSPAGTSP